MPVFEVGPFRNLDDDERMPDITADPLSPTPTGSDGIPPDVPLVIANPVGGGTVAVFDPTVAGGPLPVLRLLAPAGTLGDDPAAGAAAVLAAAGPGYPLLPEQSRGWYTRPGLLGHRITADGPGRNWSTAFTVTDTVGPGTGGGGMGSASAAVRAADAVAGLSLRTDVETVTGGGLRMRHTLTNTAVGLYVLESLEVAVVVPDRATEVLDFTGTWGNERVPQRHRVTDGTWMRENRRGKTGHDNATLVCLGEPGFSFADAEVWAVHLAWSGDGVYRVERSSSSPTVISAGELLLPGEIGLKEGESYTTPWVYVVAVDDGLDGVAAAFHGYLRSLAAHPSSPVPVNLNVWEAVYFRQDLNELTALADLAAGIGVERYVLDDGWFGARRDARAGLGDWVVSTDVWPDGLGPLVEHVRSLGMVFGLWFEPEMVNPNSDLYRAHPDWVLKGADRTPLLGRNQLVLDLSRPEVREHLLAQISAVLSAYDIGYVKWDHNRDLLEAGTGLRNRAPAVHEHTLGFYALLDTLRQRHPGVQWESCAGGGGRVDLGVLERVQRVWTSDMTDAMARQQIQRWTGQLAAPEYLGAHISAPVSHQTERTFNLEFRAATAFFYSFGIEWNLLQAGADDLAALSLWIDLYKEHRDLLHTGRTVRVDSGDPAVLVHGVVATDRRSAIMAYVQTDLSASNLPVPLRIPGLDPAAHYRATWIGAKPASQPRGGGDWPGTVDDGPLGHATATGTVLASVGLTMPRRRPQTVTLIYLGAV